MRLNYVVATGANADTTDVLNAVIDYSDVVVIASIATVFRITILKKAVDRTNFHQPFSGSIRFRSYNPRLTEASFAPYALLLRISRSQQQEQGVVKPVRLTR